MKKIVQILLLTLLCLPLTVGAQNPLQKANDAYVAQQYEEAIALYEALIAQEGVSTTLYYNLGNAYFKSGEYAPAILNYERALLLSPNNEDAAFNLAVAQAQIVDKIEPVDTFILTRWKNSLIANLSTNSWAIVAITTFLLFMAGLFLYLFSHKVVLRKIAFFGGLAMLLVSLLSNHFAAEQKSELLERNEAIIFAPTVTLRSTPDATGTELFVLHEGTKVTLLDQVGGWAEVLVSDGNRGWISLDKIEII